MGVNDGSRTDACGGLEDGVRTERDVIADFRSGGDVGEGADANALAEGGTGFDDGGWVDG